MGFFDILGPGSGQPSSPNAQLDPNTNKALYAQQANSVQTPEEVKGQALAGVDQQGAMDSGLATNKQGYQALGGDQSALSAALGGRAQRNYDLQSSNLQHQAELQAPITQFNRLQQGAANAAGLYKNLAGIYSQNQQAYENMRSERAQILGSVLGNVGSIAGNMLGNKANFSGGGAASNGAAASQGNTVGVASDTSAGMGSADAMGAGSRGTLEAMA